MVYVGWKAAYAGKQHAAFRAIPQCLYIPSVLGVAERWKSIPMAGQYAARLWLERICWQTGSNQCMFGATCNYKQRQELFGRRRACKCIGGNHAWTDKLSWAVGACTFTWSGIYLCNGMERMGCFQLLRSGGAGFSRKKAICQRLLFRRWI